MDNQVFEEAPVAAGGDAAKQLEKQARQLAYDTRWHVKKQLGGKPVNAATMEKLLLQRLQKSTALPAVKVRAKEMLVGKLKKKANVAMEDYQIEDLASDTLAKAMFKVFVEGIDRDGDIQLDYIEELFNSDKTKYKIRVTDVDKGTSYIRFATLDKISQLRSKGLKVEKTEHGDPREDEAKQGAQTAAALGGGRAKKDYDRDGKVESGAKEYRGSVHNAIQRKTGGAPDGKDTSSVKEDFIGEVATQLPTARSNDRKITGFVDNSSIVKVFPEDKSDTTSNGSGSNAKQGMTAGYEMDGSFIAEKAVSKAQQRFIELVNERMNLAKADMGDVISDFKTSDASQFKGKSNKKKREMAIAAKLEAERKAGMRESTGCEGGMGSKEKDPRSLPTERELIKNKLRAALGVKNPIVMVASEEAGDGYLGPKILGIKNPAAKKQEVGKIKSNIDRRNAELTKAMQMQSYEPEGDVFSEEESDRSNNRSREAGDWRSRSERGPVRRRPSVADDPRYGSMSDAEWERSPNNPANKPVKRRRYNR